MLFTCRNGGVSSGPWGSADGVMGLNLGNHVGDVPSCVRMNRNIVSQLVPTDPKWMRQVHGTTIVEADSVTEETEADAAFTMTPGVVCAVMVADCLPVLLADQEGAVVAAVHAGWRSLAAGIIQRTIARMAAAAGRPLTLSAWLGPRIGAADFEVDPEVLEAMLETLPDARRAFTPKEGSDRLTADLAQLAKMALLGAGLEERNIADCGLNTYGDKQRFYSYRRDGEKSGRHAALVWIKP